MTQAEELVIKPNQAAEKDEMVSLLHQFEHFLDLPPTYKEKLALGKKMREECPRVSHGTWKAPADRSDPIEVLASQDQSRLQHLIPFRYGRMMQSPFAFYRGAAAVMASDLSRVPRTKLTVQLCGDCHLSNFGIFATPERNIIFDLNDFDETLPGPFEWDLKRLATSFAVAAISSSFTRAVAERCVRALAAAYRSKMEEFANSNTLQVWYEHINWEFLANHLRKPGRKQSALDDISKLKQKRSQAGAVLKLTGLVDGRRKIKDEPPLVVHSEDITPEFAKTVMQEYALSLWQSRRRLLQKYHFVDVALKVVGVGSVGTAAYIALLQGEGGDDDYIFLQAKEASRSVLEKYIGRSEFAHSGERIVNGQRLLQAASDLFLGWTTGPVTGKPFYVRQLMDVKAAVPIEELDAVTLEQYAEVCAFVLARAHARTGDPILLYGYLGKSDTFDQALTQFALAYMDQNAHDHAALVDAVNKGKIHATPGI